jgi:hypothetical protein
VLSPGSAAGAALARIRPAIADDLVDSFGIGVHVNHQKGVYGNHGQVTQWLEKLGVRHIRSRLALVPDVLDQFENLSHHGIKIHATCGEFGDPQTMDEIMRKVRSRFSHPGRIFTAFEGINEPNNDGKPWIDETRMKTKSLHAARNKHGLAYIPIVAPALARVTSGGVQGRTTSEQATNLGDLSAYVDLANMHVYPRGMAPSVDIAEFARYGRRVAGPGPVVCTEGGYFTAMGYHGGPNPVPENVAAAYAPQHILEHWRAGTLRFFRYELLDEPNAGPSDREGTLGMINTGSNWTPKGDFGPTRQLLRTMSDPGPKFTPHPIDMLLSNKPGDLRSAVFAKRNGTHVLALWLGRKIYDPRARRMLVPSTSTPLTSVRLTLGRRRDVTVQHLTNLGHAVTHKSTKDQFIGLTAGVTLVTIR